MGHLEAVRRVVPPSGDLAAQSVAEILHSLAAERRSGRLTLQAGDVHKAVIFASGTAVHVASSTAHETLGAHLVGAGVFDLARLQALREVGARRGARLAEVLLSEGILDANSLFNHIRAHFKEKLIHMLAWTEGIFAFEEGDGFADQVFRVEMDVPRLVLEGLRRYVDQVALGERMPVRADSRVYLRSDPPWRTEDLRTTPREARLLRLAERRSRLSDVANLTSSDVPSVIRELFPYFVLEAVGFDLDPEPAPPPPPRPSGVTNPSEDADARPSWVEPPPDLLALLRKRGEPQVPPPVAPRATPVPDPALSLRGEMQADMLAQEGRRMIAAGRPERAILPLRKAVRLVPADPSYKAALAAALIRADAQRNLEEAKELARDARKGAPDLPEPYFVLGRAALLEGRPDLACGLLRRAAALDPDDEETKRVLAEAERKRLKR